MSPLQKTEVTTGDELMPGAGLGDRFTFLHIHVLTFFSGGLRDRFTYLHFYMIFLAGCGIDLHFYILFSGGLGDRFTFLH